MTSGLQLDSVGEELPQAKYSLAAENEARQPIRGLCG
jgi:hypothetical protein